MFISSLKLKNFRCFPAYEVDFNAPFVLIQGPNGAGKTSLLEALYYSCYLRSFKTKTTRELLHHNAAAEEHCFSIKLQLMPEPLADPISVTLGYSQEKRIIKHNDVHLKSHKELLSLYRVIAITDDDLMVVKGYPEVRRYFIDQAISLFEPSYTALLRRYNHVLQQRNALLSSYGTFSQESYSIWTDQLIELTQVVRSKRQEYLLKLEHAVNNLLYLFFKGTIQKVSLVYDSRQHETRNDLFKQEQAMRRSLIGAHLDDFRIILAAGSGPARLSRVYASRGQQKLLALLLKVVQPAASMPQSSVFLLDDISLDLDTSKFEQFFELIASYNTQVIVTSPLVDASRAAVWQRYVPQVIDLVTS